MLFEPEIEAMPREQLRALQERRLRELVDRLLRSGGLQGERLRAAGVTGGDDVSLDRLPQLPMVTKADLWENYPFGLLQVPREGLASLHGSSGTGGRPTLVGYTQADLDLWSTVVARALCCGGAQPGNLIHNAYGYGLFTGGLGVHYGALRLGATVVPMSGGLTERQVRLIVDLRPEVLTCTPSYAITIGEALQAAGVAPEENPLRFGVFGAEPWSESLRAQIEGLVGLRAVDIYGLSEVIGPGVSCECVEAQAGLHVNEDVFLVECVDPETGEPVPDGVPGELVFTTPTKQALPLLRYRTGDIASLNSAPCACGRTLVRMSKVLGRRDDMLVIRGVNVYPSEVEAIVLADPRLAAHYLLVEDRRSPVSRLILACELADADSATLDRAELARGVAHELRERLGVGVDVRIVGRGELPRTETGKAVRLRRWVDGPPPLPGLGEPAEGA